MGQAESNFSFSRNKKRSPSQTIRCNHAVMHSTGGENVSACSR
jgi:hypothetical protein